MSELQRKTAAQTARANFIKYPEWFDELTGRWSALSNHPRYEICRKIRSNPWRLTELNPQLSKLWSEDDLGFYLFVIYVGRMMGPRPTPFHILAAIDTDRPFEAGNLKWHYQSPRWKRRFADSNAQMAERLFGSKGGGALMPEGLGKTVGELSAEDPRYAWGVEEVLQSFCMCSPDSFWAECNCGIALRARYEIEE